MSALVERYMTEAGRRVERTLDAMFKRRSQEPETLRRAMRYSLFAGGKRLRPALVLAAAECCGLRGRKALKAAAALEMIHTYSLIHDDLPAMDDDDLRRGKPTNHKVFGEAMAILAGDGLLTEAFAAAAANARELGLDGKATADLIAAIAGGAGSQGMVGGQVEDLEAEDLINGNGAPSRRANAARLERIHLRKTAALIEASLEAGAIMARAGTAKRAALKRYGRAIGLAFQIADDILDVVGDKAKLGKKGSDKDNNKLTYVSLHGVEKARAMALSLTRQAHRALEPFAARARVLHDLADFIIARDR